MKRPDLTGHDGWQAVDATPQELSGGEFQLGPAPHSAISADAGGNYDVDFVHSEVDADIETKLKRFSTAVYVRWGALDTTTVGKNITTKAVGGAVSQDITGSYKTGPLRRMGVIILPESEVELEFDIPATVPLGSDIVWTVSLNNPTVVDYSAAVVITGAVIEYNGTDMTGIGEIGVEVALPAGGTDDVALVIPELEYASNTNATRLFEASFAVGVINTTDLWLEVGSTRLVSTVLALTLNPDAPIAVDDTVTADVDYTNPLSIDLNNVIVTYSVSDGLLVEGESESQIIIGTIGPGQDILISQQVLATKQGTHQVTVTINADELSDVFVDALLVVFADCNNNGIDDTLDINGGTSPDCNDNGAVDECDIAVGTSPDVNGDGIPDECNADCNDNGVLDAMDIAAGTSDDCSGNGIPDECEQDCNVNGIADVCEPDCNINGIADECDIASGSSADLNLDGIPDECSLGACCDYDTAICTSDLFETECAALQPDPTRRDWTRLELCSADGGMIDCELAGCAPSAPALAQFGESSTGVQVPYMKARALSISGGDAGRQQAIRVTWHQMPPGWESWEGRSLFAQEPICGSELGGTSWYTDLGCPAGAGQLQISELACDPYFTDWSARGVVHLIHEAIAPRKLVTGAGPVDIEALYHVQFVGATCDLSLAGSYSATLEL